MAMLEMPDLGENVRRGAALLDERIPDWFSRIDLDRLDISDGFSCVLGQVTGKHYSLGLVTVGLHTRDLPVFEEGPHHGFTVPFNLELGQTVEGFRLLRELWTDEISARTKAQTPA